MTESQVAARQEAIARVEAELNNVGLPSYAELLEMLTEAQKLGLTFDCGSAYISRAFIDKQDALNKRINAANRAINA